MNAFANIPWETLLGCAFALLVAFGFEFINGFHDTANAVTTVIYTHSLKARWAVLYSGIFNFGSWAEFVGELTTRGTGFCRARTRMTAPSPPHDVTCHEARNPRRRAFRHTFSQA